MITGYIIQTKTFLIIGIFIFIVVFGINAFLNKKSINKPFLKKWLYKGIFITYVLFLIGVTLSPIVIPVNSGELMELKPNINLNILDILNYRVDYYSIINLLGNVILLMPLPILLWINGYKKSEKVINSLLICLVISLGIESCQYIEAYIGIVYMPRTADILDIILNTLGGICGCILLKCYKIYRVKKKR